MTVGPKDPIERENGGHVSSMNCDNTDFLEPNSIVCRDLATWQQSTALASWEHQMNEVSVNAGMLI